MNTKKQITILTRIPFRKAPRIKKNSKESLKTHIKPANNQEKPLKTSKQPKENQNPTDPPLKATPSYLQKSKKKQLSWDLLICRELHLGRNQKPRKNAKHLPQKVAYLVSFPSKKSTSTFWFLRHFWWEKGQVTFSWISPASLRPSLGGFRSSWKVLLFWFCWFSKDVKPPLKRTMFRLRLFCCHSKLLNVVVVALLLNRRSRLTGLDMLLWVESKITSSKDSLRKR